MYFYYRWPYSHTDLAVVTHDGPVGDVIMTDVDPEYRHCAKSKGSFANEDIEIDNIYDSVMGRAPGFVAEREGILSQKRIWPLRFVVSVSYVFYF